MSSKALLKVVFTLFGAASLVRIFFEHVDWPLKRWIEEAIRVYSDFLATYFSWISTALGWAAALINHAFDWHLTVYPHSIDIFIFLLSYIGIFSSVTWTNSKLPRVATIRFFAGLVISLVVAFSFGVVRPVGLWKFLLLPTAFVSGVGLFILFNGVRAAIYYPPNGVDRFLDSLILRTKQFREWVAIGGCSLAFIAILYKIGGANASNSSLSVSVVFLMLMYAILGAYRFYKGPFVGEVDSREGTWFGMRLRSGSGEVGFLMLLTVFWSVAAIAAGI